MEEEKKSRLSVFAWKDLCGEIRKALADGVEKGGVREYFFKKYPELDTKLIVSAVGLESEKIRIKKIAESCLSLSFYGKDEKEVFQEIKRRLMKTSKLPEAEIVNVIEEILPLHIKFALDQAEEIVRKEIHDHYCVSWKKAAEIVKARFGHIPPAAFHLLAHAIQDRMDEFERKYWDKLREEELRLEAQARVRRIKMEKEEKAAEIARLEKYNKARKEKEAVKKKEAAKRAARKEMKCKEISARPRVDVIMPDGFSLAAITLLSQEEAFALNNETVIFFDGHIYKVEKTAGGHVSLRFMEGARLVAERNRQEPSSPSVPKKETFSPLPALNKMWVMFGERAGKFLVLDPGHLKNPKLFELEKGTQFVVPLNGQLKIYELGEKKLTAIGIGRQPSLEEKRAAKVMSKAV